MRVAPAPVADRTRLFLAYAIGFLLLGSILVLAGDQPVPVLSSLVALTVALLVMRHPIVILVGLLFLAPFHTALISALANKAHLPIGPLQYWKDVLILALFVRGVFERVRLDGPRSLFRDAGNGLVVVYIFVFVAMAAVSPPRSTVNEALGRYVEGPLLLLAILFLRPTRRQLWLCIAATLGAATVMGTGALIERFGPQLDFHFWYGAGVPEGGGLFVTSGGYRAGSFLNSPLVLGFYLAAGAPLAASIGTLRSPWRAASLLAFAAVSGGLITTVTRSAFLGGGIGVLAVLLLTVRNPRVRLSLVGIFIVVASSAAAFYASSAVFSRPESNVAHTSALRRDLDLLQARPFGYGLGTTDRFSQVENAGRGVLGVTESTYFAIALEAGVHAIVVYLATLFVTGMRVRSSGWRARRAGDAAGAALAGGAAGAMVAVAISGLFLGIHELSVEMMLWVPPAIAIAWSLTRDRVVDAPVKTR